MGFPSLVEFIKLKEIDKVKVLLEKTYKRNKLVEKLAKENPGKIEILYGTVASKEDVIKSIEGASYLFNLAAAIPPRADKHPMDSYYANEVGPLRHSPHVFRWHCRGNRRTPACERIARPRRRGGCRNRRAVVLRDRRHRRSAV